MHPQTCFARLTLADTPNAVAWARRYVADVLDRWLVPSDTIETVRLLVSELTTNAVQHPRLGDRRSLYGSDVNLRTVTVMLELIGLQLRLYVHDHDRQPPVPKEVGPDSENGRGLFIVAHMSHRWGYYFPSGTGGKVVWCEVALPDPTADGVSPTMPQAKAAGPEVGTEAIATQLIARTLVGLRAL